MTLRPRLGLSIFLLAVGGCSYLENRGADLVDIFTLEAGAGLGAHAGIKATDALGLVVGYNRQRVYALHGRYAGTANRASRGVLVLSQSRIENSGAAMAALFGDADYYAGPNAPYLTVSDPSSNLLPVPLMGATPRDSLVDQKERWELRPHRMFDLHAELSLGVGLHVGLSPGEFLDFVVGWFGFDLAGDEIASGAANDDATP